MTASEHRALIEALYRRWSVGIPLSADDVEYLFALARAGCEWHEATAQHEHEQAAAWARIAEVRQ